MAEINDDQAERLVVAAEGIAHALSLIAMALMREDDAEPAEAKRDPLRTLDDEPLPNQEYPR